MTHTDTDIAEILERFDEEFPPHDESHCTGHTYPEFEEAHPNRQWIVDFIIRECLALKKKWEREHGDNQ